MLMTFYDHDLKKTKQVFLPENPFMFSKTDIFRWEKLKQWCIFKAFANYCCPIQDYEGGEYYKFNSLSTNKRI